MSQLKEKLEIANKLLLQVYKDICNTGDVSFETSTKVTDYIINDKSNKHITEPKECPVCSKSFFTGDCKECGFDATEASIY